MRQGGPPFTIPSPTQCPCSFMMAVRNTNAFKLVHAHLQPQAHVPWRNAGASQLAYHSRCMYNPTSRARSQPSGTSYQNHDNDHAIATSTAIVAYTMLASSSARTAKAHSHGMVLTAAMDSPAERQG